MVRNSAESVESKIGVSYLLECLEQALLRYLADREDLRVDSCFDLEAAVNGFLGLRFVASSSS